MLSRIAESLYWMARHLERADNTARVLDINVVHMLESDEGLTEDAQWRPLLTIVGADEVYQALYPDGRATVQRVIHLLTQDPSNPGCIHNCLRLARENARAARDRISKAMWESLNEFWLVADEHLGAKLPPWRAAELYSFIHREVATFLGLTETTMMRGEAHSFVRLGCLQERADMTARILDVRYHLLLPDLSLVGSPLDYYQWGALLKSLSGFESYRRRYQNGIRPIDVVEFVMLNPDFPRSITYSVNALEHALTRIGYPPDGATPSAIAALRQQVVGVEPGAIIESGLHQYLEELLERLSVLGDALQSDYFEAHPGDVS
ncbi:alpha-E domain-containing protein [Thiorhodococcus mannitoliphagus]|uniref:Alpha-E domain-containing protein n=1 Tax=Thiorhodococcus mannitoliphagus TaxID=329406 RepID=A0A6P1DXS0_9GAMM|nr:alpha-E domain-containing protein [Thiorhodococcus mannitoliphagus]NEX20514.1 alpha-E domain-containing protein [Thiorhodococcus mannitoliphagus]